MTVPAYRAGTGSQPDPPPATARAAVDDLFRLHAVDLVRFALMLVGDQSTAEDVVQDAFLGLYRAWDRVRDPDAVLGYLRTAVVNGTRSVHRSRGRARLLRVPHDPPVWSAEAAVIDGEDYPRRNLVMFSAAISPDGNRVYVVTRPIDPSSDARLPTTLTAYSASRQGVPVTIATWTGGAPSLLPIGSKLLISIYGMSRSASAPSPAFTAYLIDPATRTRTAVRVPGLPGRQYLWLDFAW